MSMIVYVLVALLIIVILAVIIPVVLVKKRKNECDKTNMDLFNDTDKNKR